MKIKIVLTGVLILSFLQFGYGQRPTVEDCYNKIGRFLSDSTKTKDKNWTKDKMTVVDLQLCLLNELSLKKWGEKIILKMVRDTLGIGDSLKYGNTYYDIYKFELYDVHYRSAFLGSTLYRIVGDGEKFMMVKKTYSSSNPRDRHYDSLRMHVNSKDVERYKTELEKYGFWYIRNYKGGGGCLDGEGLTVGGLNGGGIAGSQVELASSCLREKELPVQIEEIFKDIFLKEEKLNTTKNKRP